MLDKSDVDQSIPRRFEWIVATAGARAAIQSRGRETTYDALNHTSNAVARALLRLRSTAAEPIALLLGQEDRTVSAVLGVLKAGKFYVPLDATYPADRLSFVLHDSGARLLITDCEHIPLARSLASADTTVVTLDDLGEDAGAGNPGITISANALAAVFYTSGSSGRPKGVMQTHRLVLHRVLIDTNSLAISADDRLSLLSSPGYSTSLRHLFGALLNGASVCPFNLAERGLAELAAWLARERITIYASVPAVFRQLMAIVPNVDGLDALRIVHLGGDTVTAADVALHHAHLPPTCTFMTSLASNETGQVRRFIAGAATAAAHLRDGMVPVGFPLPDKEVLIVDEDRRPIGSGQVGEIAVRSAFLSPGYWRQPQLTAKAFRADPQHPGKRIYYTGDLGVLQPDGCLFYKGRADSRVKIRGIRVEIGDVEEALRSHPQVDHTVVVAREIHAGEHALVAYVVARPGSTLDARDLRRFLISRVPDCMVPSTFVFLDNFPFTAHGKIDRSALPPPDDRRPRMDTPYVAPVDPVERRLAATCESLIGIRPIGNRDNLLDLGADSLTLLQLTAQIEADFNTPLPPAAVFTAPTVAELAAMVRSPSLPTRWSPLVPVQPNGTKPPFFWFHGVTPHFLSRVLGPDQPVFGLEHQSQDGTRARYTRVETIAACYLREIRTVQRSGPFFLGGFSFGGVVALEAAQQLAAAGERVGLLVLLDPPSLCLTSSNGADVAPANEPTRRKPLVAKLRRHQRVLARLSPAERMGYVGRVVTHRTADRFGLPHVSVTPVMLRATLALGMRLPAFLRSAYIFDIYGRAISRYAPRPYAGRTVLFKGDSRGYQSSSDWPQLLTGTTEMHVVEAEHTQLPDARFVPLWAETLKRALAAAQDDAKLGVRNSYSDLRIAAGATRAARRAGM